MIKLCFVIENLGSGGAQKQLYLLLERLATRRLDLTVYCFNTFGRDFYSDKLTSLGVKVIHNRQSNYLIRIWNYNRFILQYKPLGVVSMLYGANLLTTLSKILHFGTYNLIVSDRTGIVHDLTNKDRLRYQMYRVANKVLTNSSHTARMIEERAPWLSKKIEVIWNIIPPLAGDSTKNDKLTFLFGARYHPLKNHQNFIRAFILAVSETETKNQVILKCFGSIHGEKNAKVFEGLKRLILEMKAETFISLNDETESLEKEIEKSEFCALPSYYEGCPNFIIEGMTASKVILMSNVCSNPDILPQKGGSLFDPKSVSDIKESIVKAIGLKDSERKEMGEANRIRAFEMFNPDTKVKEFLSLLDLEKTED